MITETKKESFDKKLNWSEQRKLWNALGMCAREACERRHNSCEHRETHLLYCIQCARKINEGNAAPLVAITK